MGRIFISAGHGGAENGWIDPGVVATRTTETREIMLIRDRVVTELRSRGYEVLSVPDDLSAWQTIDWINTRDRSGDIALEIHADAHFNPGFRGAGVYYIAGNLERKQHADLVLLALARRVPQLVIRGALPDTASGLGSISVCRQLVLPSLYLQIGFLTNSQDRSLIQTRHPDIALGIADGLASWSRSVSGTAMPPPTPTPTIAPTPSPISRPPALSPATLLPPGSYLPITINLNGRLYGEQGILINGNACIPVDLVDRLGVQLDQSPHIRRVSYGNVVYVKAIDLREFDISVSWNDTSRTLSVRSILQIGRQLYEIVGKGYTSEVQMLMFLRANSETGLSQFPDIARLYRDEAGNEGINHDIAFAQMCLETGFLCFGEPIKPSQNNFGGLGAVAGNLAGASFPSARLGVRAHIQHLKAYANTEPLREEIVDPRFNFVTRGIAPHVKLLTGRWSSDPHYGDRIISVLRQLYEASGLL